MTDLNKIAKAIQKKYGGTSIASEIEDSKEYISTGNLALDLCLEGGIAWGYVSEWSGGSGSGKTLMLQLMLADAQKKYGATGIWFDREGSWFNERAEELGINIEDVLIVKPEAMPTVDHMNAIASEILDQLDPDRYTFMALDSISAFETELSWDKANKRYKADMGKGAKAFHQFFRKVLPKINSKFAFSFTNQRTFKIGVLFGSPETTTGGEGPKYYTTYRLKLDDKKAIIDVNKGNEIVGNWIEATVIKTRRGPNYRKALFPFYFKEGIPPYGGYARLLVDRGYLEPKNKEEFKTCKQTTVIYNEENVNENKIEKFIESHPELIFSEYPEYKVGEVEPE